MTLATPSLKSIGIGVMVTIIINVITVVWYFSKLDSRVSSLEEYVKTASISESDYRVLETKVDFYADSIKEIKQDIKEIKESVTK